MTFTELVDDHVARLVAGDGDDVCYAAVDLAAQAVSRLMLVPGPDHDLHVSGTALHLNMARDELARVIPDAVGVTATLPTDEERLIDGALQLIDAVRGRLAGPAPGEVRSAALARTNAASTGTRL